MDKGHEKYLVTHDKITVVCLSQDGYNSKRT